MHKLCGPPFPAIAGIKLWSGDDLLVGNDVLDDGGVVGDAAVADLPVHDPQQRTQALAVDVRRSPKPGAASPHLQSSLHRPRVHARHEEVDQRGHGGLTRQAGQADLLGGEEAGQ